MKCPHCLDSFHDNETYITLGHDDNYSWRVAHQVCPTCHRKIIRLEGLEEQGAFSSVAEELLVYPKGISRSPISKDVGEEFARDYRESCLTINDSAKASAALSRRCLQNIIREKAGIKGANLDKEIDALLKTNSLPPYLAKSIDAVRVLGNFAAHPIKSTNTGEIVDVEPGEAEWLLDVLEGLFDFYFVQSAELDRKRDKLNKKLIDAGKLPLKYI